MWLCASSLALSACAPAEPAGRGFNLLLVTLDTVRADRLGCYGYRQAETPHLDGLARGGLRFTAASAVAPLTLPSHASLLSGLLPPSHGLRLNGAGGFPADRPTLATHLAAAGYRTAAFVGAFVLDRRFGLGRGFERYDDEIDRDQAAGLQPERPGAAVVDRALAWLAPTDPRPFFAWVHLFDAHAPYRPPEPFASRHAGRPYDGEIAEVDHQVGRLLDGLAERGLRERTLVIVVADHGEGLGDHGELTHGLLLYQPTLEVPWLMEAPEVLPEDWVVESPVSLADLAPTAASLLGLPWPSEPADGVPRGRDLAEDLVARRQPSLAEVYAETRYPTTFGWSALTALRRGPAKYIAAPDPELYDLQADPAEAQDLATAQPDVAARLAAALEGIGLGELGAPAGAVDAATRARLAALGYVALPAGSPQAAGARGRDPKTAMAWFRSFEEGSWALQAGRFEEARRHLATAVAADPANSVFRSYLARALLAGGDLEGAVAELERAVRVGERDPEAWYNLGAALQQAGRGAAAVEALARAVALDPERAEAVNLLAVAQAEEGRLDQALALLERARTLDPRDARVWNNLGNVRRAQGAAEEAEAAYREAIRLAPRYADPLNGLGSLEAARDRPAAALALFDQALALDPSLLEVRLNRAIALELSGSLDEAARAYEEVLARVGSDPAASAQGRAAAALLAQLRQRSRR